MNFLTDADLEDMTGLKQPAAQIRWLQKWKIRHVVRADGKPRVTWAAVNGVERLPTGPNFQALQTRSA